ncbi:hypothetical protein FRAAL1047 [Frankia alni ACN14a]|uniref:Uncharacterized protein n=1 Tax=Frankia alni (strain DSM 45986 / CECT 9034 / ACN14a) TaxID=326424 RepID=Q0RRV3_FRAAA|nr:hypothetical protein FRAAL1047 [Frankia alni ACN14a]
MPPRRPVCDGPALGLAMMPGRPGPRRCCPPGATVGSHSAGRHSRGAAPRRPAARTPLGFDERAYAPTPPTGTAAAWDTSDRSGGWYGPAATPTVRRIPPRPPFAPPGELDTLTGPLSVSTTARQARQSAPGWDDHPADGQRRGWPRHGRFTAGGRFGTDRQDDDRYDNDQDEPDQYDADRYDADRYEADRYEADSLGDFQGESRFDGDGDGVAGGQSPADDRLDDDRYGADGVYGTGTWHDSDDWYDAADGFDAEDRFHTGPSPNAGFDADRFDAGNQFDEGDRFHADDQFDTDGRFAADNRFYPDDRFDEDDRFAAGDRLGEDGRLEDGRLEDGRFEHGQFDEDGRFEDGRWSDFPAHDVPSWEQGSRFAASSRLMSPSFGASFTASRMPTTSRTPTGPRRSGPSAAARNHAPAERVPGAHRAPIRRGNGRVRLAAAGTASLAGLSALVAGVAFGGDGGGGAAVPNAGEASRIQYSGTDTLAYGASQSQASRDRTQSSPPRAALAPSADRAGSGTGGSGASGSSAVTTVALGPTTAPIPIISLTPRDQPTTGPTDLRSIAPSAGTVTGASATAAPTTTATPSASDDGEATSPAVSPSATPSTTASPGTGALPFHPIDVEPLLGSWFSAPSSSSSGSTATTSSASTSSGVPAQRSSSTPITAHAAH